MTKPRIQRRYELREPNLFLVDFHEPDWRCPACEGAHAGAPDEAATPLLDAFCHAAWLAALGFVIASAIAFAIDPHGAWLALTTVFTGGR